MNYQLTNDTGVIRLPDGSVIPSDPSNSDWIAYQAWIALGNVPLPYVAPAPTQDQIDAANARADATIATLKAMTPAQAATWVTNNVVDLASAKNALIIFAKILCILARRI